MRGYVGEGRFTDDPLNTFGGAGVVEIPHMQKLLRYICENGFEHHVAANLSERSRSRSARSHHPLFGLGHVLARHEQRILLMAIVAGVDFGTLSVRVSLVDSERGLLASADPGIPAAPQARRSRNTPPSPMTTTCGPWPQPRAKL